MDLYEDCREMFLEWKKIGPPREPLLQGRDLIDLGMTPGPQMGEMLEALKDARREGDITDREAAVEWVKARLTEEGPSDIQESE